MDADLLIKVGLVVGLLVAFWVLPDWERYRDRARALHLVRPEPPHPSGPPIERIAADARRIRAQIRQAPAGMPVARLRGWHEAYDDVLVAACHALGLEERLGTLPEGAEHDLERERVERMLVNAGLLLRPSA
jgi:hypothetical protein